MATTQEMIKARQLMKDNWLTLTDAVAQARTPVTPTTPTTPPLNTPQTMQGVNWETFQVAPVNPQTGLSQPQTSQPTQTPVTPTQPVAPVTAEVPKTEIASTAPKVEAPIDYNTSAGRESEIQKNVSELTKTNPNLLKDRNAYNKAFGYDTADQGKKAILDASFTWSQPAPVTASSLYNIIASKQEVPLEQRNSGAYRVANNRYQRVNQYVNMTPSEVNQAFTSGKLVEGSQTFEDLKLLNPKLVQDAVNLRKVNGNKTNIFTYVNNPDGTPVKVNNLEKQFQDQYEEDHSDIIELLKSVYNTPTYAEMQAQINTPEVKAIQEKATAIEMELNKIDDDMANIDKSVEAELSWSWASGDRIRMEKIARKEALQKEKDSKLREYTTQYNKATNLINQNTEMFKYAQEQKKNLQTAIWWIYTKQYENQLALQKNQAEFDQKIKQQAQAMNDPTTAISTMVEEYKKLGIPFTRSTQQIIQDFQTSGLDLPTYLSQLQGTIQSKPEYKALQEYNMSKFAPKATENFELKEVGGKTYKFNQATGQYEIISPITAWSGGDLRYLADQFPWQAWAKNNNPAGITWNANFDKWTGTAKLLADAGIQFAKWTPRPANEGGNYVTFATIEDGLKAQQIIMSQTYGNSTVGQMLASWVGTWEWANYAKQVAGMAWVDPNVKVSSLTSEQLSTLQMAKIKKESPGLYWILSQGTGTTGTQVSSDAQNYFNLIQKGTTSYEDVFKKLGGSKVWQALMNEINALIAEKWWAIPAPPDSEQVKKMDDLIGRLDTLLEEDWNKLESVSGLSYGSLWDKTLWYSKEQALGNLKFVLKWNTLQQLIDAKAQWATFGALSNEELRMLQESASPLLAYAQEDENKNIKWFKVDEATLKAEVKKLRDLFVEKREKMVNPWINQWISVQNQVGTPTQTNTGGGQTIDPLGIR